MGDDRHAAVDFKHYHIEGDLYILDPVREKLWRRIPDRDGERRGRILALSDAVWYMGYLKTVHIADSEDSEMNGMVLLQEPEAGITHRVAPEGELENVWDCVHYMEVDSL